MKSINITLHDNHLTVLWDDGGENEYHYLWLRDNCPSAFHPQTRERNFDLLSVSDAIHPVTCEVKEDALHIRWSEGEHDSRYDLAWLKQHAYNDDDDGFLLMPKPHCWRQDVVVPRARYDSLLHDEAALLTWLEQLARFGISIVENMADTDTAMENVALRVGHLRQTNFGATFNVRSKPNPNNQAYTAERLPLHTDLPNQETPPGYQFLHCLHNDSTGGESVFVDGFTVAEQLKREEPHYFNLLAHNKIPFRFHDDDCDIREMRPVIALVDGNVNEILFNAHIADTFNLPPAIVHEYYLAYRLFIGLLNDARFVIRLKLAAGQMAVFDNRRVLHGRDAFNPQSGKRHLRGCYVDRTEFKSKYRVLSLAVANANGKRH